MNRRLFVGRVLSFGVAALVVVLVVALFVVEVPAVQGGIVGGLIGLLSSQVTLYFQRLLRERGKLRCSVRAWTNARGGTEREERSFNISFFNEKDVNLALWDIKVKFHKESAKEREYPITLVPRGDYGTSGAGSPFSSLNLPSRVSIDYAMFLRASETTQERLKASDRGEFVGVLPGGEVFTCELPSWDDQTAIATPTIYRA
jgi:hypothetical protein